MTKNQPASPPEPSATVPQPDPTEGIRRSMLAEINTAPKERAALEAQHGQVWDAQELARDFAVVGFMAPFVVVRRKADGVMGSLLFQHNPRFYFGWKQDSEPDARL